MHQLFHARTQLFHSLWIDGPYLVTVRQTPTDDSTASGEMTKMS